MKNYIKTIYNFLHSKVEEIKKKQEDNYRKTHTNSLVVDGVNSYRCLVTSFTKNIIEKSKSISKYGNNYLLLEYPDYIESYDKENIANYLCTLGYYVCYHNPDVLLIHWESKQIV